MAHIVIPAVPGDRRRAEPVAVPLPAMQQRAAALAPRAAATGPGSGGHDAMRLANLYHSALTMTAMGFLEAATEALREVTASAPGQSAPWRALAALLRLAAKDEEADAALAAAGRIGGSETGWPWPEDARTEPQFRQAEDKINDMLRGLPPADHLTRLREILLASPRAVVPMRLLAQLEWNEQDWRTAILLLERAVELAPGYVGARADLAALYMEQRSFSRALTQTTALVEAAPENPAYLAAHVDALRSVGRADEALVLMQRMIVDYGGKAGVWSIYAQLMQFMGQRDECVRACRKCLVLEPGMGEAYWTLSELKGHFLTDDDVAEIRALLAPDGPKNLDRVRLYYALGSALERRADYAGSFAAYATGAGLWRDGAARSGTLYQHQATRQAVRVRKEAFSASNLASRSPTAHEAAAAASRLGVTPIFVLGMPRAGSTLVEQILGSHSLVEPTRELPVIEDIVRELIVSRAMVTPCAYPDRVLELSKAELAALGDYYVEEAAKYRSTDLPYFIDKRPWNWLDIGLIRLILPHAKIIDVRRAPMAACFAMFKQLLPNDAAFSYDLGDLGRYYTLYLSLMQHWTEVFPNRVHTLSYESLVDQPDAEIRGLLAFCELPFEAGCLRFWETDRTVATPSAEQVRRPIFREAVEQWRHFEPWLGKAEAALAEAPAV